MLKNIFYLSLLLGILLILSPSAHAVPSYARQTGENCVACHTSFPELTPFGREFKLNGYTLGEAQWLPLAIMMQASTTTLSKSRDNGGNLVTPKEGTVQFDSASLFIAGKVNDHLGTFIQYTYSNDSDQKPDGSNIHHSQLDNTDIRVIEKFTLLDKSLVIGGTLNNNPSVQDVWNTTPAWGYPYNGPNIATPGPSFSTMIDGGLAQQTVGLGGYFWWDRHLYGELSFYGTANKLFRVFSAGQPWESGGVTQLNGRNNPYWRLAWNQEWGANSWMVGTYGMQVDAYPTGLNSGPSDQYTDVAFDTQYQYISDPSVFSLQSTFIHEHQKWGATSASNASDNLNTFKIKGSYLYDRKYGTSLGYVSTFGSHDDLLYGNVTDINTGIAVSNKPNSQFYVAELDYNPKPNMRLSLQYRGYMKLDGASNNIDGNGRSASDNNSLSLIAWFAY